MIDPAYGRRLVECAIASGLELVLTEEGFRRRPAALNWERDSTVDGEDVLDALLIVPHFSKANPQDSLEIHYRIKWSRISALMTQSGLPSHISEASHIDASIGHLMAEGSWREMNVYSTDTEETLGNALLAMWAAVIKPFADLARSLPSAVDVLAKDKLTGPNRHWVRAAAFALLDKPKETREAVAVLDDMSATGQMDADIAERLQAFEVLLQRQIGRA